MPSTEVTEWMAYEQVTGPLGAERLDLLIGIVAATVANSATGRKRALRPADFTPQWDRPAVQTWQEQLAIAQAFNRSLGGTTGGA